MASITGVFEVYAAPTGTGGGGGGGEDNPGVLYLGFKIDDWYFSVTDTNGWTREVTDNEEVWRKL